LNEARVDFYGRSTEGALIKTKGVVAMKQRKKKRKKKESMKVEPWLSRRSMRKKEKELIERKVPGRGRGGCDQGLRRDRRCRID